MKKLAEQHPENRHGWQQHCFAHKAYTANMCSGITVEVHLKNCNFEKLQFFTVDQCSLYFLQLKNCNFNIFTVFKNTTNKKCKN